MIKIIKPNEPILTENLIIVLYGQPGCGKTSLGFSTDKPLLLDFDLGAQRALNRKDVIRVSSWNDIVDLSSEHLTEFNTIVIDTAGRLLEIMMAHIIKTSPKMENKANGGLSLQGYGLLNTMFKNFILKLKSFKKDVILLAHDKEDKSNDKTIIRPDAVGSSKIELVKIADLLGYVYLNGKDRYISFNPSEEHLGKNCAEIPDQNIPHLSAEQDYLAKLITFTKNVMNSKSAEQIKAEQEFQEVLDDIHRLDTLESLNVMIQLLAEGDALHKQALLKHGLTMGFEFDKANKCFKVKTQINNDFDNLPQNKGVA